MSGQENHTITYQVCSYATSSLVIGSLHHFLCKNSTNLLYVDTLLEDPIKIQINK